MECPRKREMGPIIKKFLLSFIVYMKMPKPPAVTIADFGKALVPKCPTAYIQQGEIIPVDLIRR